MKSLVLLPSFDSGRQLVSSLTAAKKEWPDVWTVIDGSTDGSDCAAESVPGIRMFRLTKNSGKGAAVLHGFAAARSEGFTHALVMDSDGQHPPELIKKIMHQCEKNPSALLCGQPVFGSDAPTLRVLGRRLANFFSRLETLGRGPADSLCGFRLYPIAHTLAALENTRTGRGFDFETVAGTRLAWAGTPCLNFPVPIRYPSRSEGGVSHFRYLRDNLLLTRVHAALLSEAPHHLKKLNSKVATFEPRLGHAT
ncbi:MAG: glycosyltransferase family 2 protein [Verrucomicrobia bacterium]|nr:glycosyltransferase family 2 protein [Verrucomicrobiota bacterium]